MWRKKSLLPVLIVVVIFAFIGVRVISNSRAATPVTADFNNDGVVNIYDLGIFLGYFKTHDLNDDFNNDGVANVFDLGIFVGHFGEHITPAQPVVTRDPFLWPFAVDSPWNTPIGSNAIYNGSPLGNSINLNAGQYSSSSFSATDSDPLASVTATYGIKTGQLRIPAAAEPSAGTDNKLMVYNAQNNSLDEFWKLAHVSGNTWTAGTWRSLDIHGSGISGGIRASGFSQLGGQIRQNDVDKGSIPHALVISISCNNARLGPVWPASSQDGGAGDPTNSFCHYAGTVPLGTLLAIPPSVDITKLGLTSGGLMLAKAMQDYGLYVGDTTGQTGGNGLGAEPSLEGSSILTQMRTDKNQLISLVKIVSNNSSTNVGGGGTPRAPAAPPMQ
jgi:hypothetical protein